MGESFSKGEDPLDIAMFSIIVIVVVVVFVVVISSEGALYVILPYDYQAAAAPTF